MFKTRLMIPLLAVALLATASTLVGAQDSAAGAGQSPAAEQMQQAGGTASTGPSQTQPPATARLRQLNADAAFDADRDRRPSVQPLPRAPFATARLSEFESFSGLRRFGADLVTDLSEPIAEFNGVAPADYLIQAGDELQIQIWGSVDADLRLTVDRSGRISVPRVGTVMVAGTRHADLQDLLNKRVARVFKNFELSVSLGKLRGIRVFVTGFAVRPGAYAVAGLSTLVNALMRAGGPAAAGSFRAIELRRGGRVISVFDLYALMQSGDRTADAWLQSDDVIHVRAVGMQVALRGSVNSEAIYELQPGETLADLLKMAGGLNAVADRQRVAVERLDERLGQRVVEILLPQGEKTSLKNGDVVRAFSAVQAALSGLRQNKRIRVEGEVARPGEYVLPPDSTLADALRAAGGATPLAYLAGAHFMRETVRQLQQENYERAIRDLEADLVRKDSTTRINSAEDANVQTARSMATTKLIERMRATKPTGRVVLQLQNPADLPPLALEDGDRLYLPARPTTVGVFGSVFNAGSYLFSPGRSISEYLRLAGGSTRSADDSSVFVVRANGTVVSARQSDSGRWFSQSTFGELTAEPGDTVFVPEEIDKTTLLQSAKDWTQVLYQLGIGLAGFQIFKGN